MVRPEIGRWYEFKFEIVAFSDGYSRVSSESDRFEVVAFDADDGTIEIQHEDGAVEEMDIDDWNESAANGDIVQVPAPMGEIIEDDEDEDSIV
jgi:hypothetical protein